MMAEEDVKKGKHTTDLISSPKLHAAFSWFFTFTAFAFQIHIAPSPLSLYCE
jgi:hypothetical protein